MEHRDAAQARGDEIARVAAAWERERKIDLVCEGGGVLGIALAGAYSVLEEREYPHQNLVGTSAGAIVAALIAAGYRVDEIKHLIFDELDFNRLVDPVGIANVPLLGRTLVGKTLAILWHHGIYKGDALHAQVRDLLAAKGFTTFGQRLHDPDERDPRYRYKLHVMVSDLTGRQLLRLPMDAVQLGIAPDDLPVADAVRMSAGIPLFYRPVRRYYGGRRAGGRGKACVLVDGGMLSNFPIRFLDSNDALALPKWPTFGLRLAEPEPQRTLAESIPIPYFGSTDTGRLVNYLEALVQTMVQAHDRLALDADALARTISIPTGAVSSTNFALSRQDKEQLYEAGRRAARDFLDTSWSYAQYLATFRTGTRPSRRQVLEGYMRARLP